MIFFATLILAILLMNIGLVMTILLDDTIPKGRKRVVVAVFSIASILWAYLLGEISR